MLSQRCLYLEHTMWWLYLWISIKQNKCCIQRGQVVAAAAAGSHCCQWSFVHSCQWLFVHCCWWLFAAGDYSCIAANDYVEIPSTNNSPIRWETWMPVIISIVSFLHYYANYFMYPIFVSSLSSPYFTMGHSSSTFTISPFVRAVLCALLLTLFYFHFIPFICYS